MAKRCCETCINYILTSGLFRHYQCLQSDTKPDYIEDIQRENGKACSYWTENRMTLNGKRLVK